MSHSVVLDRIKDSPAVKPFKDFMDKVNQYFDGKSKIPVRVSKNDFVTNNLV